MKNIVNYNDFLNEGAKPSGYWTKEKCQEESLKYNTRNKFRVRSIAAYNTAFENGWLDEICKHMIETKKPNNYWTKEKCQEEALKYNNKTDFLKYGKGAYQKSMRNGWLDEVCSHMIELQKPSGHWTKEMCKEEALKYGTKSEFRKNTNGAYNAARKNGWLDEITSHMVELQKPSMYWTKKKCQEEALKYNTRTDFQNGSSSAYQKSMRNGWLDDICSHMEQLIKPIDSWTFDECKKEALKYNTRTDFRIKSHGAFQASIKNGWYKEICSHMNQARNKYIGYAYEFPDNSVYVGITSREKRRESSHMKDELSQVFKHIKETGLKPKKIILFKPIDAEKAAKLEGKWVDKYIKDKWNVLNVSKPGSLGGITIFWTYKKCKEAALKCKTRYEFTKNFGGSYNTSIRNGWLDEICGHMDVLRKKWTKEECKEEALKYNTKIEFRENNPSAYQSAYVHGWLDEICSHMEETQKPSGYWTKEKCQEEALKYKTKTDFTQNSGSAYVSAAKNGWLDDICSHMIGNTPKGYWTYEKCKEEALKYKNKGEFRKGNGSAFAISHKKGWLDEFFPKN